ncbi:hypothetical protein K9L67_04570 [Candidatus Woesearchaeota archaeon]|nr:hypothetical protein [Candidatus Woesearchaeota archaeon]MCF7901473.1 hypothetical protein [Candidatus Woesearchaeota archaeon]MCF8013194.1 hypothetical protein [Candidatus Woesearchaeota archaeon]
MKYLLVILVILLMIPIASANAIKIDEQTTHKITTKQYEKSRFVFSNSPKSETLHLTMTGGILTTIDKTQQLPEVLIEPGQTKIIEAKFDHPGTYYILNEGETTSIFAIIIVQEINPIKQYLEKTKYNV